ncbi:UvrD-helicase domain-containing protein, partial [Escherichia coli]|nr:UvrD-helicase domain-containing protein [Escherichia coli]
AHWLLLAERQMDEASVFTIHGFCQRMLSLNAFESGMLFEQQLIEDESELRYQACADFWRHHRSAHWRSSTANGRYLAIAGKN